MMTNCKVRFITKDKFDKFAYNKAMPMVNFIIKHIEFLPCLCDGLTSFCGLDSINENGRRGKNKFRLFLETYDFADEESSNYLNEFEEIFRIAYDIRTMYPNASVANLRDKLGKVRGIMLELLIEEFVKGRYKQSRDNLNNEFGKGCIVVINNKEMVIEDRVTVDIAGWDGIKGEFYETKVGPQNFEDNVLKLLSLIKHELDKFPNQSIVGCVTMVNKEKLIEKIESIKMNIHNFNSKIEVIGKRELVNLIEEPFSIYA